MLTGQPDDFEIRSVTATVHGRVFFRDRSPQHLLVGFHGYAETADINFAELSRIPGIESWSVASVQALHPFYSGRTQQVVASWMTSQDRELAIADNVTHVRGVVDSLPRSKILVFAGFSQGAAMAYRSAAQIRCDGVVALGGDVPPDVTSRLPPVLIGRGIRDEWYSAEKIEKDLRFLASTTHVESCVFDGGHEWTDEFRSACGRFLASLL